MRTGEKLPRRISQSPPADQLARRATRVISMVHELHKAGYQRLRIHPGVSPSGNHWRCNVTYAANIAPDGYDIRNFNIEGGHVAPYTTGDGSEYFGWKDGGQLNARQMAQRFVETFPMIAKLAVGRDWPYAGWLTDVLGRAEQGTMNDLLILYADYTLDRDILQDWQPPPPPS